MFASVRARLTLWYTAILALVLVTFSGISYALLSRAIRAATDATLVETARQFATNFATDPNDLGTAATILRQYRYDADEVLLYAGSGSLVAASPARLAGGERNGVTALVRARVNGLRTIAGGPEGDGVRVAVVPLTAAGREYTVAVAHDLDEQADRLEAAARAVFFGIPAALVIAAAGGYLLARKSLAPVIAMSVKARQIGAETLGQRIEVGDAPDELAFLASTLNDLLERLQRSFESQRRFMADASHELRTPISVIQGEADVILSRADRSAAEYRESMDVMRKSSRRLTRIVEDLFLLARTDAGSYPTSKSRVDLEEAILDCVRIMRSIAAAKGVEVTCEVPRDSIVIADADLLHRLLLNLIDNAVKFTGDGGRVRIDVTRSENVHEIRVRDSGPGIAPADQPRVFDRFFRGERIRGATTGAGLGLPIARWIAEAHGGSVAIESSDAKGTTFLVTLPID
jgi:two-component system OmpR family sensor kinase